MKTTLSSITISGQYAVKSLQRIITQNLYNCSSAKLSGVCNSSGKVTHIFWVQNFDHYINIWVDRTEAASLLKLIQSYDPLQELNISTCDRPIFSDTLNLPIQTDPWELYLIKNEIAQLRPHFQNKYTPQMLNLDKHQAICLKKGCFIGYEGIARIHFRGKTKRRIKYITPKSASAESINSYTHHKQHHCLIIES